LLYSFLMPELSPHGRNRWYRLRWPDERHLKPAWADKYFDNHAEAFAYYQRLCAEDPAAHVHRPVRDHENRGLWVVCVERR
jgi:hypothetical protein